MKKYFKIFLIFIYFAFSLLSLKESTVCSAAIIPNVPSLNYIQSVKAPITLELNDDNTYYVIQSSPSTFSKIQNKNSEDFSIFGEDALTEENVLKYFIFNQHLLNHNSTTHKVSPNLEGAIYTRAP
ncbi:hypothetical protein IJ750_00595 [bacterium]|nr:hypothetical protein [bacterium]